MAGSDNSTPAATKPGRPSWAKFRLALRRELTQARAGLAPAVFFRAVRTDLRNRLRAARESFTAELGRSGGQQKDNHGGHVEPGGDGR